MTNDYLQKNNVAITTPTADGKVLTIMNGKNCYPNNCNGEGGCARGNWVIFDYPQQGGLTPLTTQQWFLSNNNLKSTCNTLSLRYSDAGIGDCQNEHPLKVILNDGTRDSDSYNENNGTLLRNDSGGCTDIDPNDNKYIQSYVCFRNQITDGNHNNMSKECARSTSDTNNICVETVPQMDVGSSPPTECKLMDYEEVVNCCSNRDSDKSPIPIVREKCGSSYKPNGDVCLNYMMGYCSRRWDDICSDYIENGLDASGNNSLAGNARKLVHDYAIEIIKDATMGSGSNDYDPRNPNVSRIDDLINLCNTVPGSCDSLLDCYCKSWAKEDLYNDGRLQELCGCHLNSGSNNCDQSALSKWTDPDDKLYLSRPPNKNSEYYDFPDVSLVCDPVCNYGNTVQRGVDTGSSWLPDRCQSTICIVDDITINQVNSQGDVYFQQKCGCEKGRGCMCFIDQETVNIINSNPNIHIEQDCGDCYLFDKSQPDKVKSCKCSDLKNNCQGPPPPPNGESFWRKILDWLENNKKLVAVSGGIFIFVVLVMFSLFYFLS